MTSTNETIPTTIADLEAAVTEAARQIAALERESRELLDAATEAAHAGDVATVRQIADRRLVLPYELVAARKHHARLKRALLEARLTDAKAEYARLAEETRSALAAYEAAKRRHDLAQHKSRRADSMVQSLREQLRRLEQDEYALSQEIEAVAQDTLRMAKLPAQAPTIRLQA